MPSALCCLFRHMYSSTYDGRCRYVTLYWAPQGWPFSCGHQSPGWRSADCNCQSRDRMMDVTK